MKLVCSEIVEATPDSDVDFLDGRNVPKLGLSNSEERVNFFNEARCVVTDTVVLINKKRLAAQKLVCEEKKNALNVEQKKKGKALAKFKGESEDTLSGISNLIEKTSKVEIDCNEL